MALRAYLFVDTMAHDRLQQVIEIVDWVTAAIKCFSAKLCMALRAYLFVDTMGTLNLPNYQSPAYSNLLNRHF
jgi:hypothetical protein